jgi:diacylglycerol O-acyltransferase / wax synthase
MDDRIRRLTAADASNLAYETVAAPLHIGTIAVLEGERLLDPTGILRLALMKNRLERRMALLPQLRRRLYTPGLLGGRPLWVDDPSFSIVDHVHEAIVDPPGEEGELLAAAERILRPPLDRGRPPWELWFLTGLAGGHVGLILKLHHAVTDGMGLVALLGALLDLEPDAPDPDPVSWSPTPAPGHWELVIDNLAEHLAGLNRAARWLGHPLRLVQAMREVAAEVGTGMRDFTRAPRSSINGPISPGRELRSIRFSLAEAQAAAHASGAKVNDVLLDLAAGGLSAVLEARAEQIASVELIVSVPVSLRSGETGPKLGNQTGVITLPLPVGEPDAHRRLELIAAASRSAKAEQKPAHIEALMAWLAATPVARAFVTRQRIVNTFVTNVMGPPMPLFLLGARVLDALPVVPIAGNVRVSFGVVSYAGTLSVLVVADAATSADLDVLVAGMRATWSQLATLYVPTQRPPCQRFREGWDLRHWP